MGVESIVDIKSFFDDEKILGVFSHCMYMPTPEKLRERAKKYMSQEEISIFGFSLDEQIVGVIVIEAAQENTAEIKGIAVDPEYRQRGIGKRLIQFVCETLLIKELTAETDDDAVGFYRGYGFETEKFLKNDEYVRYNCVLRVDPA